MPPGYHPNAPGYGQQMGGYPPMAQPVYQQNQGMAQPVYQQNQGMCVCVCVCVRVCVRVCVFVCVRARKVQAIVALHSRRTRTLTSENF